MQHLVAAAVAAEATGENGEGAGGATVCFPTPNSSYLGAEEERDDQAGRDGWAGGEARGEGVPKKKGDVDQFLER